MAETGSRFREDKTTQAAAILIGLNGGTMDYIKLIKLLYFVDRAALSQWERPVTFDLYYSMNYGPVLSRTLDLITEGPPAGHPSYWAEHISQPAAYTVSVIGDVPDDTLSDAEVELIQSIYEEYGRMGKWRLVDLSHKILPEWHHPHGSSTPISYEDILRAVGKGDAEIAEIERDLDLLAFVDECLAADLQC
jgi:uncharacterized phage-associated protein